MSNKQKVLHRDIHTFYSVSEVLACGHRYESLTLLADSLTAKHRTCPKCAQSIPVAPKKPSASFPRSLPRQASGE